MNHNFNNCLLLSAGACAQRGSRFKSPNLRYLKLVVSVSIENQIKLYVIKHAHNNYRGSADCAPVSDVTGHAACHEESRGRHDAGTMVTTVTTGCDFCDSVITSTAQWPQLDYRYYRS